MVNHEKTLDNGLRVQAIEMPGTNAVTALILVGAGSRYEEKRVSGISHFLEHMFFKGGKRYPKPKDVAEAIDGVGGEFNAFTGKEVVGYYVKSAKSHLSLSLDVLSDMLVHARFPKEEIEKERGVILEEMAMYQDLPLYQISWDFEKALYGDQALGRDQIGTRELINSVQQEDFQAYRTSLYAPQNTVITLAGDVTADVFDQIETLFTFPTNEKSLQPAPWDTSIQTPAVHNTLKNTEQYHISFGVLGPAESSDAFSTAKVLSTILGGNMSSRMFMKVREELGFCYSIKTKSEGFSDTGFLTTQAGVRLSHVLDAIQAIRTEYDRLVTKGIEEKELEKAKSFICGKTDLSTEDTEQVAYQYGRDLLLYKRTETFDEWKEKVRAVSKSNVEKLAGELLQPERYRIATIGPKEDTEKIASILTAPIT